MKVKELKFFQELWKNGSEDSEEEYGEGSDKELDEISMDASILLPYFFPLTLFLCVIFIAISTPNPVRTLQPHLLQFRQYGMPPLADGPGRDRGQ
ncbi:5458_t:CDS:2 [Paraglomus brasilianum]|uniref:5458_t:CDS:1 n=1 Tax=Paraglomus brasilianum TaxID=144538 RepID=A0A9N8YUS0_9GLOM|nr:5458_t:CDS:2 [Paraglomus brasilianum]